MKNPLPYLFSLTSRQWLAVAVFVALIYGVGRVALLATGVIKPTPVVAEAKPVEQPKQEGEGDAMMLVRPYLREHLNDWGSYDSQGYSVPEAIASHNGAPAWRVRHRYRAKNGFGGVVLNDQLFFYTHQGVFAVTEAR